MSKTLFALVLILAAGCRAGEEARSSERTERKEPKPSPERSAPREDRPLAKPGAGEGFTAEERATMEVAWKAEGPRPGLVTSGKETVVQSYPYSTDPATLDWNRSAAVRLLIQTATGKVLESLGGQP